MWCLSMQKNVLILKASAFIKSIFYLTQNFISLKAEKLKNTACFQKIPTHCSMLCIQSIGCFDKKKTDCFAI